MVLNSGAFKDFFKSKFNAERTYVQFEPHHFEKFYENKLQEMAAPGVGTDMGDIVKTPIPVGDKDDRHFLQQFPPHLWRQAIAQRYNMLQKKISELHDKRMNPRQRSDGTMTLNFHELYQKLKQVIKQVAAGDDSSWNTLSGDFSPEVINRLKNHFNPRYIQSLGDSDKSPEDRQRQIDQIIDDEAHKEAYEEIKAQTEDIPNDEEVVFNLKGKKVVAKPYLGRLYHKIERTSGQPHHRHSGLHDLEDDPSKDIPGQLGYDLGFPEEHEIETVGKNGKTKKVKKATTRGLGSWPTLKSDAINHYLTLNQHHVFGDLVAPEGSQWRPVTVSGNGQNQGMLKDSWILDQLKRDYEKKFERELRSNVERTSGGELKHVSEPKLQKEARKLAKMAVLRDLIACQNGNEEICKKVSSPPVPGRPDVNRKFAIPQSKIDPRFPNQMSEEERDDYLSKFIDANGAFKNIIAPDVYLPHVQKDIKTPTGVEKHWVPVTNPSHFFRKLGSEDSDYEYSVDPETGERKRTGNYSLDHIKDRLTGHKDDNGLPRYVRVDTDEYDKTGNRGHQAPAAFHPNQNSKGRYFISRADPRYEQAYAEVFDDTTFKDFRAGVISCAFGGQCGGAGAHEKNQIRQNVDALVNVVAMHAKNNLGDPQLRTRKDRSAFARGITASFVQTDLGRGTRRNKNYGATVSQDQSVAGGSGDSVNIAQSLQMQGREGPAQNYANNELGRGGRLLNPGSGDSWLQQLGQATYNGPQFRETLRAMKAAAQSADAKMATAMQAPTASKDDIKRLLDGIGSKNDVIDAIKNHLLSLNGVDATNLAALKSKAKPSADEREELGNIKNIEALVDDTIKGWIEAGADTSEKLFAKFEADPKVIERSGGKVGANTQATDFDAPDAKAIIDKFIHSSDAAGREDPSKDVLQNILNAQDDENVWKHYQKMVVTPDGSPGRVLDTYFSDQDTMADWGWAHKGDEEKQKILHVLQAYLNKEFGAGADQQEPEQPVQQPTQPDAPPATVQPQQAPAIAARSIASPNTRHPGSIRNPQNDLNFYELLNKQKYHDLVHHPAFDDYADAHPGIVKGLKQKMADWHSKNWITPAEHSALQTKLDAALARQQGRTV